MDATTFTTLILAAILAALAVALLRWGGFGMPSGGWASYLVREPVTPGALVEAVQGALRDTGAFERVRGRGLLTVDLRIDDEEARVHLENLYRELGPTPEIRIEQVEHFVAAAVEVARGGDGEPGQPEQILPVIRHQEMVRHSRDQWEGSDLLDDPLAGELRVVYVFDFPRTLRFVREEDLERLGLDREGLARQAKENLRTKLPTVEREQHRTIFAIGLDGDYESSLLLIDEIWDEWADDVNGEIVVAVPARGRMAMTGSQSADGIDRLARWAVEVSENAAHVVTDQLLARRDGAWEPFTGYDRLSYLQPPEVGVGGYTVAVPEGWLVRRSTAVSGVAFVMPVEAARDGQEPMISLTLTTLSEGRGLGDAVDALAAAAEEEESTILRRSSFETASGESGEMVVVRVEEDDEGPSTVRAYAFLPATSSSPGPSFLAVTAVAEEATWPEIEKAHAEMLRSLRLEATAA